MIIEKKLFKFNVAIREDMIRIELVTENEQDNIYLNNVDIESCKQMVNGLGMAIKLVEEWYEDKINA